MNRRHWLAAGLSLAAAWSQLAPRRLLAAASSDLTAAQASRERFLPLFPLGIVVFPGEVVPLHIFEPRYRELIHDSAATGNEFGIVTLVSGGASSVGTEMRLERILHTDADGNMDVETRGLRVFRLQRFQATIPGKLYSGAYVTYPKNDPGVDVKMQSALVELFNRMSSRAGSRRQLSQPYPENLSFLIGRDIDMGPSQQIQFLSMPAERDRQAYLFQFLLRAL